MRGSHLIEHTKSQVLPMLVPGFDESKVTIRCQDLQKSVSVKFATSKEFDDAVAKARTLDLQYTSPTGAFTIRARGDRTNGQRARGRTQGALYQGI